MDSPTAPAEEKVLSRYNSIESSIDSLASDVGGTLAFAGSLGGGIVHAVVGLIVAPTKAAALLEAPEMPGWARDPDGTGYIRMPSDK